MDEKLLVSEPAPQPQPDFNFATVGAVYADGVSLIFDGETEPSEKHYKVNTGGIFHAGDRVKIASDSGTYVAEYVVGNPAATSPLPAGGAKGQALIKASAANYDAAWGDVSAKMIANEVWQATSQYDIYLRTTSIAGTPVFQIRRGSAGSWFTISTS